MNKYIFTALTLTILACTTKAVHEPTRVTSTNTLTNTNTTTSNAVKPLTKADTITINAVGDVMFGTNFPNTSKMPPNQGKDLLAPFASYLKGADVCFANAEGVFLNSGGTPKGSGGQVYCFRQPTYMASYFKQYGINLLSVANNHVADFGDVGLQSTDATLRSLPIAFAGSTLQPTTTLTIRGIVYGMAAFAPHKGSINMNDIPNAIRTVKELKKTCHIVMVSFHGGAEGVTRQRVPKQTEIFYGQNRGNVHDFAHKMIDAGADVVIGHGPHVLRAVELYNNKFIAYSLGNFCTYGMFSLGGVSGNAPLLQLKINEQGNFVQAKIISGKQYGEGGPVLDEDNKEAFNCIKSLSQADFPNGNLIFDNGIIYKK